MYAAACGAIEEFELRQAIWTECTSAWASDDFAKLERLAESYASTRPRTFSGKWKLALWADALRASVQIKWPDEDRLPDQTGNCRGCGAPKPALYPKADELWEAVDSKTQRWLKAFPDSPHATVARASYLVERAWFYRGRAYSQFVPDQAWARMHRFEELAEAFLRSHRDARLKNPVWYSEALTVAMDLKRSGEEIKALRDDFVENGHFYPDVLTSFSYRMQPKWLGSFDEMDRFARYALEQTRQEEGRSMYARLYWQIAEEYHGKVFTELKIDWPLMRAGFEDMIARYPDARNINGLGIFACMAKDVPTMEAALSRLGNRLDKNQWQVYVPFGDCQSLRAAASR